MNQAMGTGEEESGELTENVEYGINAEDTLTELIDNNKKILETRIKYKTRAKFMKALMKRPKEKYVNLLRALSTCDGIAMKNSQNDISAMLLSNEDPDPSRQK